MSEPLYNIGLVCADHAPKAGKYAGQEPKTFLGKMVKLGFKAIHPLTNKESIEHMWVEVTHEIEDGDERLGGTLDNDPIFICDFRNGDSLAFNVEEIEDVYEEEQS